ncbi:MAG: hypothetical protein OXN80_04415 [bacterium]|nr:hypothetical protein [bacterium]
MARTALRDPADHVAYNGHMLRERLEKHAARVVDWLEKFPDIATGEAGTKSSLIEPFLSCLEYDPSHPVQVSREVATELGGKIDYVLAGQGDAKVAVEAKKAATNLSAKEINQLRSYFTFSEAVAGILTNGIDYWLFTDLEKTNVMDADPYRRIDVRDLTDNDIQHLQSLTRSSVNQDAIHGQAQQERYRTLINEIVTHEFNSPSQEFLKLIGKKAGIKPLTKPNLLMLEPLVGEAISRNRRATPLPQPDPSVSPADPAPKPSTPHPSPTPPVSVFRKATLFGQHLPAENYRQMLLSIVTELQGLHPNDFAARVREEPFVKKSRKWQYISQDENDFNPSFSRNFVGGYWVDTNLDRRGSIRRAHVFLSEFGYNPDELVIYTEDD